MADPLSAAMRIASSGLQVQSMRVRIVSENLANIESTGKASGSNPYRRKEVTFATELDRLTGDPLVKVSSVRGDPSPFKTEYRPGHPAADASGYVKLPNVNMIIEIADLKQANRSYEANLQVVKQSREMTAMTLDLLKSQ